VVTVLEEIAAASRSATDEATGAATLLMTAEELAEDAAALIRTAGEGSS
jgi:hypothetical protein